MDAREHLLQRLVQLADRGVSSQIQEIDALEFRREQYCLTTQEFAHVLGIQHEQYLQVIENIRRLPFTASARAIAIGVPAWPLLANRSPKPIQQARTQ